MKQLQPKEYVYDWGVMEKHSVLRDNIKWGNRGVRGDKEVQYLKLTEMDDSHIYNIIMTQYHIEVELRDAFITELFYRLREST